MSYILLKDLKKNY